MAYIMVTTDNRTVVWIKHHTEYPMGDGKATAKLLNDISGAVLASEAHHEKLEKDYQDYLAKMES